MLVQRTHLSSVHIRAFDASNLGARALFVKKQNKIKQKTNKPAKENTQLLIYKWYLKGHWTSITSSLNFFQKKVGIFIPLEKLV